MTMFVKRFSIWNIIFVLAGILIIFLAVNVSAQTENYKYYDLNLSWENGNFSLNSLNIEFSGNELSSQFGNHSTDVLDYQENVLNTASFEVPNTILYDNVDENGTIVGGGTLELNETDFAVYVPYYENASEIVIYDRNVTEKLRIDVGSYSKTEEVPFEDGMAREENISEEPLDEDLNESVSQGEKEFADFAKNNWWVLALVLIALIAYLVWSLRKDSK